MVKKMNDFILSEIVGNYTYYLTTTFGACRWCSMSVVGLNLKPTTLKTPDNID